MKAWKKGAIVGGMWGLLGTPIFYLFIYLRGWERSFPKIAEKTSSILLQLPLILLKPLFEIVRKENPKKPDSMGISENN